MVAEHAASKPPRRCAACGGDQRFSHREYAGRGDQRAVFRCLSCGRTVAVPLPRAASNSANTTRSRKPPVDEGPPANPVLDPDTARRLLGG